MDLQMVDCPDGDTDCDISVVAQYLGDDVTGGLFVVKIGNLSNEKPDPSVPNTFIYDNNNLQDWARPF